jgi:hypothetical protein
MQKNIKVDRGHSKVHWVNVISPLLDIIPLQNVMPTRVAMYG